MSIFKDQSGTQFQTQDNKPPVFGATVTIFNGSGQTGNGTFNGTHVVPNK